MAVWVSIGQVLEAPARCAATAWEDYTECQSVSIPYLECFFIVQSTPRRIKMLIGIPDFLEMALSASVWWASSHMVTFLLRRIEHKLTCAASLGQSARGPVHLVGY